ncbi:hypothetical protein ILUMI_09463 [Ignelater luminosus]|uniref:VWFA domain-containing protein n=1 Tax=Ignelater luminosus TaxID=2038154 RepID=A0A8K0CZP3_IGNLU|nr:hypothetical protein ILUMI_09463 [Ignelater luminosus]
MRSYQFTPNLLNLYELSITSNINSRYVYTTVIKRLENKEETEQNITYSVVFPEEAFVSSFILEVDSKNYTAFITERMEDKSDEVRIEEMSNLIHLNAATRICSKNKCKDIPIKSNELLKNTNNTTVIKPNLSPKRQHSFTNKTKGFSGQFVVRYDVDRDSKSGSILINNGYCINFFTPSELSKIPKYVVFILDTSKSMEGQKLDLLKNAMSKISEKLCDHDLFSIVEFNSNVKVWNLKGRAEYYPSKGGFVPIEEVDFKYFKFPKAHKVNANNIFRFQSVISNLTATGSTDMYSALKVGLHLVELSRNIMSNNTKPLIIFLTDGKPVAQNQIKKEDILENVSQYNTGLRSSSIFTLAFGTEADYHFLEKLAIRNGGYAKRIYDASDASLQMQNFYQEISTPMLMNVTFEYRRSVANLTQTHFPTFFNGSELVVAGYCGNITPSDITIHGWGKSGKQIFTNSRMESTQADVKRMWTYIKLSQLFDEAMREERKQVEILRKAYELSLANSFATYVTSLVVTTPNNCTTVVRRQIRKRSTFML